MLFGAFWAYAGIISFSKTSSSIQAGFNPTDGGVQNNRLHRWKSSTVLELAKLGPSDFSNHCFSTFFCRIVWDGFIHGIQQVWVPRIFSVTHSFRRPWGFGLVIYHQKNTAPNLVHYSLLVMPLICFCSTKMSEKIVSLEESTNQFRRPRLLLPEFPYRFRLREIRRSQH